MIIGLCGRIAAGKSKVAELMREHLGFVEVDVARPIRQSLLGLDPMIPIMDGQGGWSEPQPLSVLVEKYGWDRAKQSPSVRRLLQRFGFDCVRDHLDNRIWERKALAAISSATKEDRSQNVVISNLRGVDERRLVEEVWLVERDTPETQAIRAKLNMDHPTESNDIDNYATELIINNGSIEELLGTLKGCYERSLARRDADRETYGNKYRR